MFFFEQNKKIFFLFLFILELTRYKNFALWLFFEQMNVWLLNWK